MVTVNFGTCPRRCEFPPREKPGHTEKAAVILHKSQHDYFFISTHDGWKKEFKYAHIDMAREFLAIVPNAGGGSISELWATIYAMDYYNGYSRVVMWYNAKLSEKATPDEYLLALTFLRLQYAFYEARGNTNPIYKVVHSRAEGYQIDSIEGFRQWIERNANDD